MNDNERIALVESYQLDVWFHRGTNNAYPVGWVADLGEPDESLWQENAATAEGGSSLAVGKASWRDAVDAAADAIELLGISPASPSPDSPHA